MVGPGLMATVETELLFGLAAPGVLLVLLWFVLAVPPSLLDTFFGLRTAFTGDQYRIETHALAVLQVRSPAGSLLPVSKLDITDSQSRSQSQSRI